MAAKPSQRGSSVQSDLRIVIIGNAGDENNKVVKSVLNCENPTGEKVGLCTLHQCEHEGRRIRVVEAPGWDKVSKQTKNKTKTIKKREVEGSVSLCPPGPHALLLVIPVKTLSEEPSPSDIISAQTHMELLSERVWKHTILLFDCDEGVEEPQIKEYIRKSAKILEKCGGRVYVLQKSTWESPAQINELLKKIDNLVVENHGDFFIPQAKVIQRKTKSSGEGKIKERRGSLNSPPSLNKDKRESAKKKETIKADRHTPLEDTLKINMDFRQFVVILMAVVGALIGAVTGAQNGVSGSCMGIILGIIVGILLASFFMYIYTHIYSRSYPNKPTRRTS